jgi:hypothetical protein
VSGRVSVEETPHGLQVTFDGKPLYGPKPVASARRRTDQLQVAPKTLLLCPSPLAWYGIVELLDQLPEDVAIMGVEAEPDLLTVARSHMPNTRPERLCLVGASQAAVLLQLQRWGPTRFRRVAEVSTNGGNLLHRSRYRALATALQREIRIAWQNRMTLSAMGGLWVRNLIRNCAAVRNVGSLPKTNLPAVVCGAGPSLDEALPLILRTRSMFHLVAVDTAVPILQKAGIVPDFVVVVEGQIANVYDFLPVHDKRYTLVADMVSAPAAVDVHRAPVWFLSRFAPVALVQRVSAEPWIAFTLPPLGSVGVAAVAISLSMTSAPIFTAGLDFAFRPGQTHATGAPATLTRLCSANRTYPIIDGAFCAHGVPFAGSGEWQTTLPMISYAEDMRDLLSGPTADSGTDRVSAIAPRGLDTGAVRISISSAEEQLKRAYDSGQAQTERRGTQTESSSSPPDRDIGESVAGFVTRELQALESLSDLLATPNVDRVGSPMSDALQYCDYLFFDFADAPGPDDRSASFLNRVRIRAAYYRDRWKMASTLLQT